MFFWKAFLLCVVYVFLISTENASANDFGVLGSVGVQYKQLTMDQTIKGTAEIPNELTSGDLSASLPVVNIQFVVFYESLYAIAKLEKAIVQDSVDSSVPLTQGNTSLATDVDREDYSVVFGYKLSEMVSVFAGYMSGKTELVPDSCEGCDNPASEMRYDGFGEYKQEYKEDGLFGGVSLGWNVEPGRIGLSLAYATMDGSYSDNYVDVNGPAKFNFEGDSEGLSAALSWTAPLTDRIFYFLDARIQKYSMDASDKTGSYEGISVETDETILGVAGGVQMLF